MQTHNLSDVEGLYRQDTRRASIIGARVLMGLAAVGALAAAATSFQVVSDAGPETLVVEIWRFAGFIVFSGLFALLAYRPLHYAGVWELVIVNKLALTIAALTYASDADGAGGVALVDGILTGVLLAAYLFSRGWRAWSQPSFQARQLLASSHKVGASSPGSNARYAFSMSRAISPERSSEQPMRCAIR
jgi:hypothetical protein